MLKRKSQIITMLLLLFSSVIIYSEKVEAQQANSASQLKPPEYFVSAEFKKIFSQFHQYGQKGELDKAAAVCERLIKEYRGEKDVIVPAWLYLGIASGGMGTKAKEEGKPREEYEKYYKKAIEAYQTCIREASFNKERYQYFSVMAKYVMGQDYYWSWGKSDIAIQTYRELIDSNPDIAGAMALPMMKRIFEEKKEPAKFVLLLKDIVKRYPRKAVEGYALLELGSYYEKEGKHSEALKKYQEVRKKFPGNKDLVAEAQRGIAKAQFNLGTTYFKQKKYARACKAFQEVIDLYPNSPWADDALYMIGECRFKEKKYPEAIGAYQKVIDTYPESNLFPEAIDGLFRCYSIQGRYDQALNIFNKYALPTYPKEEQVQAQFDMGDYYRFELNDHRGAIYAFQRFITKYPKDRLAAKAQYNIAECYKALKEDEKAIQAYQKVIDNYPQDVHASLAKRRIRAPEEAKKIEKININTASLSQLETLPHIGLQTAQAIVDYRERRGPFKRIEDIMKVPSVGPKTFQGLKDRITVK